MKNWKTILIGLGTGLLIGLAFTLGWPGAWTPLKYIIFSRIILPHCGEGFA